MIKNETKNIFDRNRVFVPLREILTERESKDRILLARILAIYDTYHIKKKNIKETVYVFFSSKKRGSLGIIPYQTCEGKKSGKEMYQATKKMVLKLTRTKIYRKLVKSNWFPIIYCGK